MHHAQACMPTSDPRTSSVITPLSTPHDARAVDLPTMRRSALLLSCLVLLLPLACSKRKAQTKKNKELLAAASEGNMAQLSMLLLEQGVDPNGLGPYGETALTSAAWSGHKAAVDFLIKEGAKVDIQDDGGDYALLFAAFHGHNAIVDALCRAKAKVDLQNQSGHTAIMIAVVRQTRASLITL